MDKFPPLLWDQSAAYHIRALSETLKSNDLTQTTHEPCRRPCSSSLLRPCQTGPATPNWCRLRQLCVLNAFLSFLVFECFARNKIPQHKASGARRNLIYLGNGSWAHCVSTWSTAMLALATSRLDCAWSVSLQRVVFSPWDFLRLVRCRLGTLGKEFCNYSQWSRWRACFTAFWYGLPLSSMYFSR